MFDALLLSAYIFQFYNSSIKSEEFYKKLQDGISHFNSTIVRLKETHFRNYAQ